MAARRKRTRKRRKRGSGLLRAVRRIDAARDRE
jgi:hypothetical protein